VRIAKFVLGLLLAVFLHFVGARLWPDFPRALDVFLVVTVLTAAGGSSLGGMLGGMVAGLANDALTASLYGRMGFVDTIIGYFTARLAQRLIFDRALVVLMVIAVATLAQQGLLLLLDYGLLGRVEPPDPLWWAFRSLAGGLLGGLAFVASGAAAESRDRRRERVEKLRLGK
jgi:rod shape-determining protein MreD